MLRPPADLAPSAWAEANVRIPEGNAIPGFYRVANAPYQRGPMDQFVNPDCYRVTLEWSAQIGKTLLALIVQGYCIAMRPRSQMMMQPSQGDTQAWLETKFNPLVESSPDIKRRVAKARGRDGVNNQRMKSYPGGFLMLAWAGSPKTMRGRSAPLIVCDEVDGYLRTPEGHPVGLVWQRSATFGDERFLLEISTPTIEGASYIDESFLAGDQRRFHVGCPHCAHAQTLEWARVTWPGRLSTDLGDAAEDMKHEDHDYRRAAIVCESCGAEWGDGERIAAIRNAERDGLGWRAAKPFDGHASYHAWEAYSTMRKLSDIVRDYIDKLRMDDLQTFANVSLAQAYALAGSKADPDGLKARAELFAAAVPAGGLYLTAGVDMQQDRLEVEIVAWGFGEESWSVAYSVLEGDPLAGDVWEDLDALLSETFEHESGARLPISAACLDTGGTNGYTQCAYEYLRGRKGRRIFGVKGIGGWGRPVVEKMKRTQTGKSARKVELFGVGVDEAKLIIMRRLGVERPGPGYCHIPADRAGLDVWCKGITSEKLVIHYVKGRPIRTWSVAPKARNEPLDCRVYALAALKIMQPSMRAMAERVARAAVSGAALLGVRAVRKSVAAKPAEATAVAAAAPPEQNRAKKPAARARRRSWASGY